MGNIESSGSNAQSPSTLYIELVKERKLGKRRPLEKSNYERNAKTSWRFYGQRRGVTIVLSLFLLSSLLLVTALVLDLSRISIARDELQRSAEATALAACWQWFDEKINTRTFEGTIRNVECTSSELAAANRIANQSPMLSGTLGDLQLVKFSLSSNSLTNQSADLNAVRVNLRRESEINGEVPLFFSSLLGRESQPL